MFKLYPFLQSLQQLETQFEFLRLALDKLPESRAKEFFATKRKLEISDFESRLAKIPDLNLDKSIVDSMTKRLAKKWGKESQELYRKQFVPDDLNKSELLLLVALFEGHFKDAYQTLVIAEPRRAFAKSNKPIAISTVFVDNVDEWRKSVFFENLVDEEVSRFDHLGFKERINFLTDRYGFKFGPKEIQTAHDFIERRHKISHAWTDRDEVKHVSPADLENARRVLSVIASRLVSQAIEKYPKYFSHS